MAKQTKTKWVTFTRRTEDPKLRYIEKRLDEMGIPHRRNGASMHAPILQVPQEREADAWALLNQKIGGVELDEIPDSHPMFQG
jgi:hypothetical protein